MNYTHIKHTIEPFWNKDSEVLILGTFPSPKSRENNFFYAHPQNRFWRVLAKVFDEPLPSTKEEKTEFLLKHKIALWDTIFECDIIGASDSSIKNVVPTDIKKIIENSNIKAVFTTGKTAYKYYLKYQESEVKIPAISLPSTSPANARMSVDDLVLNYKKIRDELNEF